MIKHHFIKAGLGGLMFKLLLKNWTGNAQISHKLNDRVHLCFKLHHWRTGNSYIISTVIQVEDGVLLPETEGGG